METNPSGCSPFSAAVLNTVLLLDPLVIASSVQLKKKYNRVKDAQGLKKNVLISH